MPDRSYGFAVGRIRVLETRLLDRARLERMADADDLDGAAALLGETEYAPLVAAGLAPREIAAAELARIRDLVLSLAPDAPEVAFLLWRWDLLNLKALIRGEAGRASLNRLGRYSPEEMAGWFQEGHPELPEFFDSVRSHAEQVWTETRDPQMLDAAIDREYYAYGTSVWERSERFLADYWRARVDLINLRTVIRGKYLGFDQRRLSGLLLEDGMVPMERFLDAAARSFEEIYSWWAQGLHGSLLQGAESPGDLAALERASENYLIERIKPAKAVPLGLEPVLGYYLAKEHETRLVNLVLTAKAAGVPGARIKERLRSVYA